MVMRFSFLLMQHFEALHALLPLSSSFGAHIDAIRYDDDGIIICLWSTMNHNG
jgi:hypothetical protein